MIQLLRAPGYPRMPWKNGAGTTLEIMRDAGVNLDGFGWRVSIADIDEAGAFSSFAGYQRIISVLEGEGMCLSVDGADSRPLRAFDPYAFAGDSRVECRLLNGAIRDFNLIYAPQRYSARLQWLRIEQAQRLFSSAATVLVFSTGEGLQVNRRGDDCGVLGRYDCLGIGGDGQLLELTLSAPAAVNCCLIELTPL
ncbi:HutD/Ves family protein [Marinobacterium sedimentorum]|uniref:HutD/Ves family protein n=1 Tax=Marinobacterium sedimentorum TaxID=2927804 RepID=UPI0020C64A2C|nr:HutD family protein [Marinobacterium sedimentorum]MCP8688204.1 HutD family protein [Marinobacterium sedimentorum]